MHRENNFGCRTSCTGLYADVQYVGDFINSRIRNKDGEKEAILQQIKKLLSDYDHYKRKFVENLIFDPRFDNMSMVTYT